LLIRDPEKKGGEWKVKCEGEAEPTKYFLSTAPADATTEQLVFVTKVRWRIERDYQELKQEFGLSHYEGRGWQGFHHLATLCVAAYGYLVAQSRAATAAPKKTSLEQKRLLYPTISSLAAGMQFDTVRLGLINWKGFFLVCRKTRICHPGWRLLLVPCGCV
jgi:SRSO17 transposase